MNLAHYLTLIERAEGELARAMRAVADAHREDPDVYEDCRRLARRCDGHVSTLRPFVTRYRDPADDEPERLHTALFDQPRSGSMALLRDLHDLYLMATDCDIALTMIGQGARAPGTETSSPSSPTASTRPRSSSSGSAPA